MTTVVYLGDGDVGEAVVYGLPFTVGVPTVLPAEFEFAGKIINNGTFEVVADIEAVEAVVAPRRGRPPRAR
jgi:hypothetical protein